MISTVTLNPALDKCVYVETLLPNDTNRIVKVEVDAGGKGFNASRVLKELGSETIALGFLGGQTGKYIEHVLRSDGISVDAVYTGSDTRTNICIQDISGLPPTTLNEAGARTSEEELEALFAKVMQVASKSSMIVIAGSLPPGAPVDTYKRLVKLACEAGSKVILDSDGEPMRIGMEAAPFMIKPNRDEVGRLVDIDIQSNEDAARAAELLASRGIELIVISMGSRGALVRSREGTWFASPPDIKPVSTIGSGDSMVAGFAHALSQGRPIVEALMWGSAAGAATAMTDGTGICKRHQVLELLDKVQVQEL